MSQEFSVKLRIDFKEDRRAHAVMKALIPDNVNFPKGLSMHMDVQESFLLLSFRASDMSQIGSLITTIDEVLEHISVMSGVL